MSKLVCTGGHHSCLHYEGTEYPSVETIDYPKGFEEERSLSFGEIIVVCKGSLMLSYDLFFNHQIEAGKILLLPPGCHLRVESQDSVILFVFRLKDTLRLCERLPIDTLMNYPEEITETNQPNTLTVKAPVEIFIQQLSYHIEHGIRCSVYLKQKIDELLILMKTYYSREKLRSFFSPVLNNTSEFTNFVLQNYRKTKSVKEFANLYSCSISCFEKKFKKAFGVSPYKWMKEKKISIIYHEITVTNKPIKQIAEEQRFNSLPQFNDFCKKHFGYPPGKIRKDSVSLLKINA